MNNTDFNSVIAQQIDECYHVLKVKGNDYSDAEVDRLSNFKLVGSILGVDPKIIWAVYAMKHVVAIMKGMTTGKLESEPLEGRFTDLHNYLFLGKALNDEAA